jgi:hypothetical protein
MGLGGVWLLMNLSANFAHARRDFKEIPGWEKELPPTGVSRMNSSMHLPFKLFQ